MNQPTSQPTVIAREPATAPHPHPSQNGRMTTFAGVDRLLLSDGTEVYECTRGSGEQPCSREGHYEGPFRSDNVQSVVAHTGRHAQRPNTTYDERTLRAVIRTVTRLRSRPHQPGTGRRHLFDDAAAELNREGITTARGLPWKAKTVNAVYLEWKDAYPSAARVRRAVQPVSVAADAAAPAATVGSVRIPGPNTLSARLRAVEAEVLSCAAALARVADKVGSLAADVGRLRTADPRAAEQLAQVQGILRELVK